MDKKHKSFGAAFKAVGEEGQVEAIVSVFGNADSYGERVMPGAFNESLGRKLPKGVWMHDWSNPVAKTLEAVELLPGDARLPEHLKALGGLYVKGQFFKDIDDSWQAYLKVREGLVDEFSIGYRLQEWAKDEQDGTIKLLKLDLYEWSPVLVGANRATATLSVKQFLEDGNVAMSLQDHTDAVLDAAAGLVKRFTDLAATREADGKLTESFKSRLSELAGKLVGFAEVAPVLHAKADEALPPALMLEWEQMRHDAQMRAIRG
jgi:HK97 family phage prohead protease